MFDDWREVPIAGVYRPVNRPVIVLTTTLWPRDFCDEPPTHAVRQHGLTLKDRHPGRQRAWICRDTGQWLALVECDVRTMDGLNTFTMQLWLQAHQFTTV